MVLYAKAGFPVRSQAENYYMQNYEMNYENKAPAQVGAALSSEPKASVGGEIGKKGRWWKNFRLPSILKTGATFLVAGGLFFGAEVMAPDGLKPSAFVGTYEARLHAQMKAAELQQQSKLTRYEAALKIANDQNLAQYQATTQSLLANYQASYDRAKIFADATARIQQLYVGSRIDNMRAEQSGDIGVISMARVFGRLTNTFSPGDGDGMMRYADNTSRDLDNELARAAQNGVTIKVDGWNTDLADPSAVAAKIAGFKPVALPPIPDLWEDAERQDAVKAFETAH